MSALVSVEWLKHHLEQPNLVVLDATYFLPNTGRSAEHEFLDQHIPGARRFDHDVIVDRVSAYPHMRPTLDHWRDAMGALGIREDSDVIVYDALGLFSAPRCWWLFRSFGHRSVRILNGGLPAWIRAEGPVTSGVSIHSSTEYQGGHDYGSEMAVDAVGVQEALASGTAVIDARGAARFQGLELEPRPGLRSGHIPGSANLPFTDLIDPDLGQLYSNDALGAVLDRLVPDSSTQFVVSCGSGVTACIIALAQYELKRPDVIVYDGSWAEWGSRVELPIASGQSGARE